MILVTNNTINYFNVFKHLTGIFTREIRLSFFKSELDNYYKNLRGVRVDEYLSYYLISFEETQTENLEDGEINLSYYPGEWIVTVEELSEDETEWVVLYSDVAKVPKIETNEFPNI